MWSKFVFFVTCLLIANGAVGQTGQLEIKTPWARATPGHAENGAAYLTIVSPTTDRLTAASSPVAKKVELHTMSMEGGVMKMRPLAAIDIPAGQTVTLSPGGMYIMLLGLTQPLREGQSFPLTLSFDHAGPRQVTVAIEKALSPWDPEGKRPGRRRCRCIIKTPSPPDLHEFATIAVSSFRPSARHNPRDSASGHELQRFLVNGPTASLSVVTLFLNADPVVKGVLALLVAASVWSWAVIIDKLWRLGAASRTARGHEERAAAARSAPELLATEERGARNRHDRCLVFPSFGAQYSARFHSENNCRGSS